MRPQTLEAREDPIVGGVVVSFDHHAADLDEHTGRVVDASVVAVAKLDLAGWKFANVAALFGGHLVLLGCCRVERRDG